MGPEMIRVVLGISHFLYQTKHRYNLHFANDYIDNYQTISEQYLVHNMIPVVFKKNVMIPSVESFRQIKKYTYDKLTLIQSFSNFVN